MQEGGVLDNNYSLCCYRNYSIPRNEARSALNLNAA